MFSARREIRNPSLNEKYFGHFILQVFASVITKKGEKKMSKIKIALNTSVMHCVVHFIKLKSTVGSEGIVNKETLKLGHRPVWKCREPTGTAHGGQAS